jgi:hypothetical protein
LNIINITLPIRKIFRSIGENNGSFGINNVPETRKKNNMNFAGQASLLALGFKTTAIAAMM